MAPAGKSKRTALLQDFAEATLAGRPLSVVDVGALWGLLPELDPVGRWLNAIGFDPDPDECEALNDLARKGGLAQRFLPYAIAGSDESRPFYILRKAASSSLLEPNSEFHARFGESDRMDVIRTTNVETRALGSLLDELSFEPEFLKLDVHGVETEILGSLLESQWSTLLAVHVEVLIATHYRGQAEFADVHGALARHHFELYDLKRYAARRPGFDTYRHETKGQIVAGDALYLRRPDSVSAEQHRRLAFVAAVFGHNDLALEELRSVGDDRASEILEELSRRSGRIVRRVASRLIRLGDIGWKLYGGRAGAWTSDQPPEHL